MTEATLPARGPRAGGPLAGLTVSVCLGGAVDEHVGRVGVREAADARAPERKQRPEYGALRVEALVVAYEIPAGVRRLMHIERARQMVLRPSGPAVVRVVDPVIRGQGAVGGDVVAEVVVG